MKVLTCAAARRRLHAYHDDELAVPDQIAVSAHLDWCDECAATFAELQLLRSALRGVIPARATLSDEEGTSLQARVVSRAKAERRFSFASQVREMFDDMHMVYAGTGAAVAATVCVVILLTMMRFATDERPGSLGEIVRILGSNSSPVEIEGRVRRPGVPRVLDAPFALSAEKGVANEMDTFVMLAGVVTREGWLSNLELVSVDDPLSAVPGTAGALAVGELVDAMRKARFEPARVDGLLDGLPVAVNMVWLVAHTTVRGTPNSPPGIYITVTPPAKKRVA
jgi:hypothetical protein